MPFKKNLPRSILLVGFIILSLILVYRAPIKEFCSFNLEKLKIHKDNFFYDISRQGERQRPVTLLQKETELKAYAGEPFVSFTPAQWKEFWNLIYGAYPAQEPQIKGLPKRMRQLTQDEIAFKLMDLYPQPFAYFSQEHWNILFGIILKE